MKDLSLPFDVIPPDSRIIELGDLTVPTGRLVICDPFQCCSTLPLKMTVTKGRFPVQLFHVDTKRGGARVAIARVLFSTIPATDWQPALTESGVNTHMVDAGLSSFMDHSTSDKFCDRLRQYRTDHPNGNYYTDILEKEFKAHVSDTNPPNRGDWCLHDPFRDGKHTIPLFSSGLGDGQYESWWGLAKGKPVSLAINFSVI